MDLQALLSESIRLGASDLHLSSGLLPMMRIDGELISLKEASVLQEEWLRNELSTVCPGEKISNLEQDFSFSFREGVRFRVNIFYQLRGISAVFRVISKTIPALASLSASSVLKNLCELKTGLVLVTGPTGCGKSTTLAAMVQHINLTRSAHIVSLEDPIEYIYQSEKSLIQQREIHQHTASFQEALRSALREDPDVIVVGEMRDLETIRLALTAAETGHLVLATLHTQSCSATINRIIDVFPAGDKELVRNMLADSLQAVISQVLMKRKNSGRIAAQEIMIATTAIRNLIRENKTAQILSIMQTGRASGMQTMGESLKELKKLEIID